MKAGSARTWFIVCLFATACSAQESLPGESLGRPAESQIPHELQDLAFDQYINLANLRDAWTGLDPAVLADAGLQLAQGERILFRSHKAVTADEVLKIAIRVASEKRDTQTLDRLAKAVKSLGKDELAASIAAARKLGGQSRSAQVSAKVALDAITPSVLSYYQGVIGSIEDARIRGDKETLQAIGDGIDDYEVLPPDLRKEVGDRVSQASKSAAPPVTSLALEKLSGESRGNYRWRVTNSCNFSVWVTVAPNPVKRIYPGKSAEFQGPVYWADALVSPLGAIPTPLLYVPTAGLPLGTKAPPGKYWLNPLPHSPRFVPWYQKW